MIDEATVKQLIEEIKKFIDNYNNIIVPNKGEKIIENLISTFNIRNTFTVNVYRSGKDIHKLNFAIIFNKNKQVLLRMDTGDVLHRNPDGELINGPHIHFYKKGYETNYAYEIDLENYDVPKVYSYFLELINVQGYNNIVEKPTLGI